MVFLQRIKELVTLGSGDVIGSVLSAIFWFYLASQIKPDAYGEIHWFLSIAGFFSYMAMFGTLNTITVYTAKNIKIQSTLYLISLIASIVLSLKASVPMTTLWANSKASSIIFSFLSPPATCTGIFTDFAILRSVSKLEPHPSVASRSTK